MRKVAVLTALLIAFGLNFAVPAFADGIRQTIVHAEPEDENENPDHDRDRTDRMHRELHEQYEQVERVTIPPLGFIPEENPDPNMFILPELSENLATDFPQLNAGPTGQGQLTQTGSSNYLVVRPGQAAVSASSESPSKYAPIQLKDLVQNTNTPADEFIRASVIVLAGLAVIAAALLGLASSSAFSLNKKPKSE